MRRLVVIAIFKTNSSFAHLSPCQPGGRTGRKPMFVDHAGRRIPTSYLVQNFAFDVSGELGVIFIGCPLRYIAHGITDVPRTSRFTLGYNKDVCARSSSSLAFVIKYVNYFTTGTWHPLEQMLRLTFGNLTTFP